MEIISFENAIQTDHLTNEQIETILAMFAEKAGY